MPAGMVFDIQRFAIHDGPGIRTTVFLKGCPLHCLWCHNPESQSSKPEILFSPEKCILCRYCESVCEQAGHSFVDDNHLFDRTNCIQCGECTRECYANALELVGRVMQVDEVLQEVLKDRVFYQNSGGGLTLSGGEPMQQFDFILPLLQQAKLAGLHTCIETSGCSTKNRYLAIQPLVDLFYFDVKETNPDLHRQYTGISNEEILENLFALDAVGAQIVLRCPIIPGLNDRNDHLENIAGLANQLHNPVAIHILPYHNLGTSKSQRLGEEPRLKNVGNPEPEQVTQWLRLVQQNTTVQVLSD